MKFFAALALMASIAQAQKYYYSSKDAVTSSTPQTLASKNRQGQGTTSNFVRIVPGKLGTLQLTQQVAVSGSLGSYGIVQTWVEIQGASDDGTNVYAISNAMNQEGSSTPLIHTNKACGNATQLSPDDYVSLTNELHDYNCSLNIVQDLIYSSQGTPTYTQQVFTSITPYNSKKTLKRGLKLNVTSGFNLYNSPGPQSLTDSSVPITALITLDGSQALTFAAGTAAALAVLQF